MPNVGDSEIQRKTPQEHRGWGGLGLMSISALQLGLSLKSKWGSLLFNTGTGQQISKTSISKDSRTFFQILFSHII